MKIAWKIEKKRGNHRPVLSYDIELEPFEIDLAVPQVVVDAALPKPPSAWRSYCYPGEDERGGAPLERHMLMTPSHKAKACSGKLTLPWRDSDSGFDDVETAFARLRRDFEQTLRNAHDSAPVDVVEGLELTEDTRKRIAAGVASARFLAAVGF